MSDRWQTAFVDASDPIFFLSRQKRIQFVNPAWEALTGLTFTEVRGLVCKRQTRNANSTFLEEVLTILAPTPEVLHGQAARLRRLAPLQSAAARWWDVSFFPLRGKTGLLGIVGSITPAAATSILASQPLPESILAMRQRFCERFALENFSSRAPALQRVAEQIRLAAQTRVPVVLVGETGTGKHWTARAIHRLGGQCERPFIQLDCARLPESILSEGVFGERGLLRRNIFGSTFLREPAALPRDLQAVLAVMIADRDNAGPQFITGFCNQPKEEATQGRLLPELLAALGPIVIELPPLRERLADLGSLAEHFLLRVGGARSLSTEAMQLLAAHAWPGNLHELFRVLADAHKRAGGERIEVADVPFYLRASPATVERTLPLDTLLEQVEKRLITVALGLTQHNKSKAAELLAIWRPRLIRRMQALGFADAGDEET